jgi:hypothetical protein
MAMYYSAKNTISPQLMIYLPKLPVTSSHPKHALKILDTKDIGDLK